MPAPSMETRPMTSQENSSEKKEHHVTCSGHRRALEAECSPPKHSASRARRRGEVDVYGFLGPYGRQAGLEVEHRDEHVSKMSTHFYTTQAKNALKTVSANATTLGISSLWRVSRSLCLSLSFSRCRYLLLCLLLCLRVSR